VDNDLIVRDAVDADSEGVIRLIAEIFDEYEGMILDVDTEEPELRAPASSFERFWVLERDGAVCGSIACTRKGDHLELKKMYLAKGVRGQGWGRRFIELVEDHARAVGVSRIEMWSDTRFETAHGVYEHLGYARSPHTRDLHDLSNTTEFHFTKTVPTKPAPPSRPRP
jgi:putative acetyltransferase